jgi:Ca-activated chloride channel family protein
MAWHNPQTKHRPRLTLCLIASVSLLVFSSIVAAQEQEPVDVIRVRTDLVAIPVTVTDSRGHRVADLKQDDFVLSDDGRATKIEYFASGAEHVALLFAIDASGSARDIIGQQRSAAIALFSRFGRGSRVAVLHFGDFVRLSVPFTTDSQGAENSFNYGPKENTGTAIFDAAATAVRAFDGSGGFSTERRIVLLISDGLDTLSSTKYKAVIDAARLRGVSFYVIHFPLFSPRNGALAPRPSSKGFRELAEQTGGRYFRIGDARSALNPRAHYDLTPVFQAIESDLRGQYVLGFYPGDAARDGQIHLVTASLSIRRRKLKVNQLRASYNLKP